MRKIVYYVASSLDGFISGPDNDIEGFVSGGDGVNKYLNDLAAFDTVIMGRNTYEFGYKYGLKPGQAPYANMTHYIFSNSLAFETQAENLHIKPLEINELKRLKSTHGTDIYLCGGGQFAGWLLEHEQIDYLKIKLNPLILGAGIRLFGNSVKKYLTELLDTNVYDNGLQIMTYRIRY
jgi:dihydrofolate reductase